jgi:hypothetical protein
VFFNPISLEYIVLESFDYLTADLSSHQMSFQDVTFSVVASSSVVIQIAADKEYAPLFV